MRRPAPFSGALPALPERSAIALIDRLVHHGEILTIEGESYRWRAAELTRKTPRSKPTS